MDTSIQRSLRSLDQPLFAPGGQRSQQGLLVCYAVAKLCRPQYSEAEVTSYVDGMCLGDSVAVFVDILADGSLTEEGIRILRIRDVLNPNGPWQSRHLRLRAHALKDAALSEAWKISQEPGTKLAPDFMTKAITVASSWARFREFVGPVEL